MDCDYQICLPKKISCGFLSSLVFWLAFVAVIFASIISGSALNYGLERVNSPYNPGVGSIQFAWFFILAIGVLLPAVITDLKGSNNQKKCSAFALVVAIILVVASSVSFEIGMYWYSVVGYIITSLMIVWLAYLSYKSTNGDKWGILGAATATISVLAILALSFSIIGRGIINPPENNNPQNYSIKSFGDIPFISNLIQNVS